MLKNSTKLTSLVVAAATIASMTPAFAATTSLEEKDGTVYRAVAYKDGKFYIDGEVEDKDNSVYYLDNGKYTELEDLDNGSDAELYGSKYVNIDDGDAYVDLSNGKVNDDDDLTDDDVEDAENNIKKKIKKDSPDGRYQLDDDDKPVNISDATRLKANYMEDYYQFTVDGYTLYSDKSGNYVDADYDLGSIKIVVAAENKTNNSAKGLCQIKTTTDAAQITSNQAANLAVTSTDVKFKKNEAITIENTKDFAKTANKDFAFKAKYVGTSKYLTQDKDYIYRMAYIGIDLYQRDAHGDYQVISEDIQKYNDLSFGGVGDVVRVSKTAGTGFEGIPVIQKISKAQNSDDIDDAKYPKKTDTYFFTEYKDYYAKKDKDNEKDKLASSDDWKNREELTGEESGWSVVNGKLNNYRFDDGNFKAQTLTLKNKAGYYYVDKDDDDFDVDDEDEYDVTVDVDGNIWILDNGKIKQYNNAGGFDTVYKCDGAMDSLSVYDKDNVIVWNEDEDQFAILGGKSTTGKENTEETTTTAQAGWVTNADGTWSYINADGTKAIGWLQSPASGLWYHMDANGIMESGKWLQDAGSWYYLNADGSMKTGWLYNGGAWYYLKPSAGNMGAMQTGWIQSGGKWYYCNASGAMLSNTTVNGYVLGADGAWIK